MNDSWLSLKQVVNQGPKGLAAAKPRDGSAADAQPEKPEEDTHPSKAYGGLWSWRDRAHEIEFRFQSPEKYHESQEYAFLRRVRWLEKNGLIELVFVDDVKVTIRGINLWDLKERIRRHMVTWVVEQGDDPLFVKEETARAREEGREAVLIYEIQFKEAEQAREN